MDLMHLVVRVAHVKVVGKHDVDLLDLARRTWWRWCGRYWGRWLWRRRWVWGRRWIGRRISAIFVANLKALAPHCMVAPNDSLARLGVIELPVMVHGFRVLAVGVMKGDIELAVPARGVPRVAEEAGGVAPFLCLAVRSERLSRLHQRHGVSVGLARSALRPCAV